MDQDSPKCRKLVIGLIGGIGSGKTLVAQLLRELGGYVIEADKLGHEALRQPELRARIVERWGEQILDEHGEIDRARLAKIVFSDPRERQALEAVVHPYIGRRIAEEIEQARNNPAARFIVIDAALLLEAGWQRVCDKVIFVDAPAHLRQQRTQQSRGWSAAEWQAREAAQWPVEEKRRLADAVLVNTSDVISLRQQVQSLIARWLAEDPGQDHLPQPTG